MYTLYHGAGTCSLAVKAALTLTHADFSTQLLDLAGGEHQSESYRRISPLAKVPALIASDSSIDGVLTEGAAILLYLSSRYPEAKLMPELGSAEYAEALKWLQFLYATVHPYWGRVFFPERYGSDADSIRTAAESELHNLYDIIEAQLAKHRYIASEQMTLADLYLMVTVFWQGALQESLISGRPHLAAYVDEIFNTPEIGALYRAEFGA